MLERLRAALADRYAVERELGAGGMASVYLAEDLKHHRQVAIKVLRPELAAVLGAERFLREIEIAGRLQHPRILPLYDSGETQGFLYYVMPYVEGESLRDRLEREKQLPLDTAVGVARDVAAALTYAHGHGVIHRDIKPENILLSGGEAVVADFGIARAITAAGGQRLTDTGLAVGTPVYMSPEQAAGSREVDARSDVYSLGCVLYEMLAGAPPFNGPTAESIIRQHLTADAPSVTWLRRAVPPAVAAAIARALAKTPADRFTTAGQFTEALGAPSRDLALARQPTRVVGLYLLASFAIFGAVYWLMIQLGLPDWVVMGAIALLGIGLPIMVVTQLVERRRAVVGAHGVVLGPTGPSGFQPLMSAGGLQRWLTWRRSTLGGLLAFAALGVVTAGYMTMRALGVGPVGTLVAGGVLEERDRLLLADFTNRTADSTLARSVTEAFRVDLAQSRVVRLLDASTVAQVLRRMGRAPEATIDPTLARELAEREGIKAIVIGDVAPLGRGYVLSASVASAPTGEVLAAVRESARDDDEIIAAVDRLSAALRERIGESLKAIRASPPLSQVTTPSLEGLRKYSQAIAASDRGDDDRAIALLEEALALDTAFAMAHRKLGVILGNRRLGRGRALGALIRAFEHRERLTSRERYLVAALYHDRVAGDRDKAIAACQSLLAEAADDPWALNTLGVLYSKRGDHAAAESLFARAFAADSTGYRSLSNQALAEANQGKVSEAQQTAERMARLFPDVPYVPERLSWLDYHRGDYQGAVARLDSTRTATPSPYWKGRFGYELGFYAAVRGQVARAEGYWREMTDIFGRAPLDAVYLQLVMTGPALTDLHVREAPGRALERVRAALERVPLDSLDPLERPYLQLAEFYAAAGRADRAKVLLADYEREVDTLVRRVDEADRLRALGAVALAEGRLGDAVRELRASDAVDECAVCALPFLAEAYDRAGNADSAVAVYERYVRSAVVERVFLDHAHRARMYRRLGELYEARGDRAQAIEAYRRFVELWTEADPELQPAVRELKARLARLAGAGG